MSRHPADLPAVVVLDLSDRVAAGSGEVDENLPQRHCLAGEVAAGQGRVAKVRDRALEHHDGVQRCLRRGQRGRAHPKVALHV